MARPPQASFAVLLVEIRTLLCTGEEKTPVHKRLASLQLQQLDRSDFQRIALHISADIHAKVAFLIRRFESFHDL